MTACLLFLLNRQQWAYLKVSWHILMPNLTQHPKHPFEKKTEQKFIYIRLSLFDEEYSLDQNQYLLRSYLDLGSQQQQQQLQVWPVSE